MFAFEITFGEGERGRKQDVRRDAHTHTHGEDEGALGHREQEEDGQFVTLVLISQIGHGRESEAWE